MSKSKIYISEKLYYTLKRIKNRVIYIPCCELKVAQREFLKEIKLKEPYNVNTVSCARIHSGKKWILKMDIRHFYESVPIAKIQNFIQFVCKKTYMNPLTQLNFVTINGILPTGAPTSGHIANACFKDIDQNINAFCTAFGVGYSRYVDDLTFSAYTKEYLNEIEKRVTEILKNNGYEINRKKTKYISDNKQQNVLGIVVNGYRIRLSKEFKRKIRTMIHHAVVNEAIYFDKKIPMRYEKRMKYLAWDETNSSQLKGYLAYIYGVDKAFYKKLQKYSKKLSKKYNVYAELLVPKINAGQHELKQSIYKSQYFN